MIRYYHMSICIFTLFFAACDEHIYYDFLSNPYVSYQYLDLENGYRLKFALIEPECISSNSSLPVLLTFPPGDQSQDMVEWELNKYWITSSIKSGWLVVSPVIYRDTLFHKGSEKYIPQLFAWIRSNYRVEGDKFHIAGVSNGGLSAFRVALDYPESVHSLTVLPGYPPSGSDYNILDRLKDIPVTLYVGENDKNFINQVKTANARLQEAGVHQLRLEIMENEEHVLEGLSSEILMNLLDRYR